LQNSIGFNEVAALLRISKLRDGRRNCQCWCEEYLNFSRNA
jgi:hypothetical protein